MTSPSRSLSPPPLAGNVSQVDRLWTTLPLIYSAHFTFWPLVTRQVSHVADLDPRMLLVFALQCAWSARLTYQSARRGFLDPRSEDYRWPLVRKALPKLAFTLLDLFFIAFAQNFLLLAAELPQYLLLTRDLASSTHLSALARLKPSHAQVARVPLNVADAVLALAFVVTLVLEMRADNQQQAFQNLKHGALDKQRKGQQLTAKERSAVERGFVAEGLWSWSRHPVRPLCFSTCGSRRQTDRRTRAGLGRTLRASRRRGTSSTPSPSCPSSPSRPPSRRTLSRP